MSFLRNKVSLAPLVGGSDLSFRMLCRKFGAEVTYTPMVVAKLFLQGKIKYPFLHEFDAEDRPLLVQIAGNDAKDIVSLANQFSLENVDGIDINCGCPQSFALEKGYGAGMLTKFDSNFVVNMCKEVRAGVKSELALTVKMRIHPDGLEATVDLINCLAAVGVEAVALHGRYYWQKGTKRGEADWDVIEQVARRCKVLVIGNGDVRDNATLKQRLSASSAIAGVMVGYGALRDPSLFCAREVSIDEVVTSYFTMAWKYRNSLMDVKRHCHWLLKDKISVNEKPALFSAESALEIIDFLSKLQPPVTVDKSVLTGPCMIEENSKPSEKQRRNREKKRERNTKKLEERMKRKIARNSNDTVGEKEHVNGVDKQDENGEK